MMNLQLLGHFRRHFGVLLKHIRHLEDQGLVFIRTTIIKAFFIIFAFWVTFVIALVEWVLL